MLFPTGTVFPAQVALLGAIPNALAANVIVHLIVVVVPLEDAS
jgi:hypothetical protein